MSDELWRKSATELAKLIRNRDVSSREVVTAHLDRIEAVNDKVNAVTAVLAEQSLAAADLADRQSPKGPLHGVPFTIKENIDCVGSATTQGVPILAEALPATDSPVVSRMKAAGAVPLARTNLPEMGLRISTDNPLRGRTMNPWDAERVAGGSSGGEGAALATGMSPMGLGNDIGGSVRNPAYCCGVTSLKPTVGRIPHATSLPTPDEGLAMQTMGVEGPMARHVADLQTMYKVLSGRDPRDPVSVDAPLYSAPPANRQVALVTQIDGANMPEGHINAIRQAGAAMADAGWQVDEVTPPELDRISEIWGLILSSEFKPMINEMGMIMSEGAIGLLQELFETYPPESMPVAMIHSERWRLSVLWSTFFEQYPVVIGPTWTNIPFKHDEDIGDNGSDITMEALRFITPANLLALPASSVPTGVQGGLPTGVQIVCDKWKDDLVLDVARIVEARCGQITPIDPQF